MQSGHKGKLEHLTDECLNQQVNILFQYNILPHSNITVREDFQVI